MSLIQHAKRELTLAGLFDKDSDYGGGLGDAVMKLVELFAEQGHSGASAARTLQIFKEVAAYKCLTALTGADEEWNLIEEGMAGEKGLYQNNRVSGVFKKDGKAYYSDAITWRTPSGSTWGGTAYLADGTKIHSRQYIKSFPFRPKTFIIEVDEELIGKDDWKFTVKVPSQLQPVWDLYEKPN